MDQELIRNFSYDRELSFYLNEKDIPNQDLVNEIVTFHSNREPHIFGAKDILNLVTKQEEFVWQNVDFPEEVFDRFDNFSFTPEERHAFLGTFIKWCGGYPVNFPRDAQQKIMLGIQSRFLAFPGNTPEKIFAKRNEGSASRLMKLGIAFTNGIRHGVPVEDILNEMEPEHNTEELFSSFDRLFETANMKGLFGDLSNNVSYATIKSVINFEFNNWLQMAKGWDGVDPDKFKCFLKKSVFLQFMQVRQEKIISEQKLGQEEMNTWKLPPLLSESIPPTEMETLVKSPSTELSGSDLVFVTYCWESPEHQKRIRSITAQLRQNGENAEMDQMELQRETALQFKPMMLEKLRRATKVIVVLSKGYKKKAENAEGGVYYEYKLIIEDIDQNPTKYILVTLGKLSEEVVPQAFKGRFVMALQSDEDFGHLLRKLQGVDEFDFGEVASKKQAFVPEKVEPLFKKPIEHSEGGNDVQPKLGAYQIKVLRYLSSVNGSKPPRYGTVSSKAGIQSADEAKQICNELEKFSLVEFVDSGVKSTELAKRWLDAYDEIVNEQIREYVYDDFEFALLRYLYHQEIPVGRDDIPTLLEDNAPRITNGYPSLNLLQMMEIELKQFILVVGGHSYELSLEGKRYIERKAEKSNYNLGFAAGSPH